MSAQQLDRCRAWLEPALRRGDDAATPWEEMETQAAAVTVQVFCGERAAILTRLIRTPEGGQCHVWLAGGDLRELVSLRPGIEAWARSQGCKFATIDGRKGWARLYRRCGYRKVDGQLRKELLP